MCFNYISEIMKLSTKLGIFQLVLLSILISSTQQFSCPSIITEESINSQQSESQQIITCFQKALKHQQQQTFSQLFKQYSKDYQEQFKQILENQYKRLQEISKLIYTSQTSYQPVVKWAQNYTHIFITIKLSHRWDSPPCLNTISSQYSLKNDTLVYKNNCIISQLKVHFSLQLPLFKQVIEPEKLQILKDGVGTYSVILKKEAGDKIWTYLTNNNIVYPIWQQISARHEVEYKQYHQLMQQIDKQKAEQQKQKQQTGNSLIDKVWKEGKEILGLSQ